MRAVYNKVLVSILDNSDKDEYTTDSGLLVASRGKGTARLAKGKVISCGSGMRLSQGEILNIGLSEGDTIYFYLPSASTYTLEGKSYTFVRMEDIELIEE